MKAGSPRFYEQSKGSLPMNVKQRAFHAMQSLHHHAILEAHLTAMRSVAMLATGFACTALVAWVLAIAFHSAVSTTFLLFISFGAICALLATGAVQVLLSRRRHKIDTNA